MRYFEIDVRVADLAELKALEKCAAAMKFTTISLDRDFHHPAMCTVAVEKLMSKETSDSEAAHYLHWRASDLQRLKFNVIEQRLVWRES